MTEKIIGYVLIVVGVAVIIVCGLNVFDLLTNKTVPVEYIKPVAVSSIIAPGNLATPSLPSMLGIGDNDLGKLLNLAIQLLILGVIIKIGFHLASLGTMMVRPIVVDLNTVKNKPQGKN